MTKHQDRPSRQLELRLLADLKAKPEVGEVSVEQVEGNRDTRPASTHEGASGKDLEVYRQIASNYFESLRK